MTVREKNVLITGATGFVGSHLIEYLLKDKDVFVYATKRPRSDVSNVRHLLSESRVKWIPMDIVDSHSVLEAVEKARPDLCFHLCAQSFVPASWNAPQETMAINVIGTVNLFEAIRKVKSDCKIQIAGSSEEYGMVYENEVPIKETNPLRPLSPYGVSKVAQDLLGYQYNKSYGLHIVRTRGFNHTGPRRGDVFVTSSFSKQITEIEKGRRDPVIHVGNLEAIRDFTDVRDMVRAYWLSLEKCEQGEVYNVSSDKGVKIKDMLNMLLGMTDNQIKIEQDPARMRPSDVEVLVGDSTKFRKTTGWKPEIPFKKTLEDLLNYWRERV